MHSKCTLLSHTTVFERFHLLNPYISLEMDLFFLFFLIFLNFNQVMLELRYKALSLILTNKTFSILEISSRTAKQANMTSCFTYLALMHSSCFPQPLSSHASVELYRPLKSLHYNTQTSNECLLGIHPLAKWTDQQCKCHMSGTKRMLLST